MQNRKPQPIIIVQGGQWGSESKGVVAAHLCLTRDVKYAIRTGAINAGHTVIYKGRTVKNQQLPTGWVNPDTHLIIGAGAYIHPVVLAREIEEINELMPEADVRDRIHIDRRAGLHLPEHEDKAKAADRHHRIGATGKGCSETIVDKIRNRNNGYKLFTETDWPSRLNVDVCDTVRMINDAYDEGMQMLIEGTQGTLLDLHLGPYPFTTSRMTSAANWIAEAGLAPGLKYETVLVVRTYPIRVAGNSGPMNGEIDWTDLANSINSSLAADGKPPMVDPSALQSWDIALHAAACKATENQIYQVPRTDDGRFNVNVGKWTAGMRNKFRVAASELHRDAFGFLDSALIAELGKLFEFTTVTRKLRRVARINIADLQYACRINRPDWIFLTFLNYEFPIVDRSRVADATDKDQGKIIQYIMELERKLGVPVKMINTGPMISDIETVDREWGHNLDMGR